MIRNIKGKLNGRYYIKIIIHGHPNIYWFLNIRKCSEYVTWYPCPGAYKLLAFDFLQFSYPLSQEFIIESRPTLRQRFMSCGINKEAVEVMMN